MIINHTHTHTKTRDEAAILNVRLLILIQKLILYPNIQCLLQFLFLLFRFYPAEISLMDHFCRLRYNARNPTLFHLPLRSCLLVILQQAAEDVVHTWPRPSPLVKVPAVWWPAQDHIMNTTKRFNISRGREPGVQRRGRPAGDKCVFISHAWCIDRLMVSLCMYGWDCEGQTVLNADVSILQLSSEPLGRYHFSAEAGCGEREKSLQAGGAGLRGQLRACRRRNCYKATIQCVLWAMCVVSFTKFI